MFSRYMSVKVIAYLLLRYTQGLRYLLMAAPVYLFSIVAYTGMGAV
jgi:hypothetical protein